MEGGSGMFVAGLQTIWIAIVGFGEVLSVHVKCLPTPRIHQILAGCTDHHTFTLNAGGLFAIEVLEGFHGMGG